MLTIKTTSLSVSTHFRKNHKNVIQKIEAVYNQEFNRLNFQPIDYVDARGRTQPLYKMTRDGWMLLVLGFTGKKAEDAKIWFIARFKDIESQPLYKKLPAALLAPPGLALFTFAERGWCIRTTPRPTPLKRNKKE